MIEMDEAFDGGCCVFEGLRNNELHCHPHNPQQAPGNLFFTFQGRITGAEGIQRICLHWPPKNPGYTWSEYQGNHQFTEVMDHAIFTSPDLEHWERVEDVRVEGLEVHFAVQTSGKPLYVAVGMPFLSNNLQSIYDEVACDPTVKVHVIGHSTYGRPLRVVEIPATKPTKDTFFLQALQHRSEWAGGRIIQHMIRYLLSDEGRSLRENYNWHFVPMVNLDGGLGGIWENPSFNFNRDWQKFDWPEPTAIRDYINALYADGTNILHAIDFHMGWSSGATSGASISVYNPGYLPDRMLEFQKAFAQHVSSNCDYTDEVWLWGTGRYEERATFVVWMANEHRLPAQTLECSRHSYWDRAKGQWVPASQAYEENLGRDLAKSMASFHWPSWQ